MKKKIKDGPTAEAMRKASTGEFNEASGKFMLRVPPKVHEQLQRKAEVEGVSLNLLVATELAQHVGRVEGIGMALENQEWRRLFELEQKRMRQAVKHWHKAHPGKEMVLPDLGALLDWLMDEAGLKRRGKS